MSIPSTQVDDEINELLLTLWDKAVGKAGYDRAEWQRFQELLNSICPPQRPGPPGKPSGP